MNKKNLIELKKRTKFFQGLVLGLFITSTFSYAVVTFNTFTSGSAISSSQMNTNFAVIKTKLDELDIGYTGSMSANNVLTCVAGTSNPTYPTDYVVLAMVNDYNDGNFVGNVYTIPTSGVYRMYLNAPTEDNMGYSSAIELSTDGGSTWTQTAMGMSSLQLVQKFAAGDKIKISAGCGSMAGVDGTSTIDFTKFVFALKKF